MDQLTIVLIILILTIIAFMSGKLPYTVISVGIIIALIETKVLTITEAFSGLTNKNVIMFAAMFVIGAGIVKSGLLDGTKNIVMRYEDRPKIVLLVLMAVAIVLSILTSAVGTMAILLPLIISIANNLNISRSKLIYPIAVVANISTTSILTPMAAAAQAMIMAPGGYTMKDYLKCGLPLVIVNSLICIFGLPMLYPF